MYVMSIFFLYNFFHNETNDRTEKGLVKIPKDRNDWIESWKKIEYKQYFLLKPITLPRLEGVLFKDLLSKRRSNEGCFMNNKLTIASLSYILQCGYGLQGEATEKNREENRTVPSAGMRYPLEIYVFIFNRIDGCKSGIYHYGIKSHTLEPLIYKKFSHKEIAMFSLQDLLQKSAGMICITSIFNRTISKYGSRGYRYVLLEAGHVAQNMLLAGTENGINILPVGGVNEDKIEKVMGFGTLSERVVYTLFL